MSRRTNQRSYRRDEIVCDSHRSHSGWNPVAQRSSSRLIEPESSGPCPAASAAASMWFTVENPSSELQMSSFANANRIAAMPHAASGIRCGLKKRQRPSLIQFLLPTAAEDRFRTGRTCETLGGGISSQHAPAHHADGDDTHACTRGPADCQFEVVQWGSRRKGESIRLD